MTIKSDRWIRRMAVEHRMIEPFEAGQVKEFAGKKIVSYGTSSYGYDIRCSTEFKIFTNINSTIVDPKAFDEKSFVDVHGEVCIIPPNSFALARTVEYFRIPRNVLVVTLGKSTYARCFRGDTRVALVGGRSASLEHMANAALRGECFEGYGVDSSGRVHVVDLDAPRFIGRDALVAVELDNGCVVNATPDHEFLLRDGSRRQAAELRLGDSLMPLYRTDAGPEEMIYRPGDGRFAAATRAAGAATRLRPSIDAGPLNHKVRSVRDLPGDHDVYCATVPQTGNFALEAGVFVSNCGIIVNVTPLEPEWEGYVTLEFSNTTPLPAKIYANEGVAQVLFFESDEVCETSYKDRGGKYQGQTGVTLPKT
jgi:deoxycytidine triphosphate deaminase